MQKTGVLLLVLLAGFAANGYANNLSVPALDPKNRDYIQSFCAYHAASPICIYKPNPRKTYPPSSGGGGGGPLPGGGGPVPTPPAPPPAVCRGSGKATTVTSAAQFQTVLNAASGGDTIVLAPGTYGTLNISKGGSGASAPIYIVAQNPAVNTSAQPQSGARSSVGLATINAGNITLCGLYFNDSVYKSIRHDKRADNVMYLQNYFSTGVHNEMAVEEAIDTWKGGTNLTLQSNYFNATRNSSYAQDYGLALFKYNGVYIRGNVFDGVFNHAVSLKQEDNNVLIDGNVFRGCGQVCVEIGQQPDNTDEMDNTGTNATITNNTIIAAYENHPQSGGRKAMLLRNEQNIVARGNSFQGTWNVTILTDFLNRGGLERLANRQHGIWGLKQNSILIENNEFSNDKLSFTGRGVGRSDQIVLRGNTGTFTCTVGPFVEAAGKHYEWSTIDRDPPTVTGCH